MGLRTCSTLEVGERSRVWGNPFRSRSARICMVLACLEDCLGRIIADDQRLDFMEHGLIEIGHADG